MAEKVQFTPEQQKVIDHNGGSLLVSAAAGSGKTRVLVERLMRQITSPDSEASVTDYLVITFTKAAASELRSKIAEALSARLAEDPTNRHLRNQVSLCSCAEIGTIHSFCTHILRENAYVLGISQDFRVAEEAECEVIRVKVLEKVLEERYAHVKENPAFARLADLMSAGWNDKKLVDMVLDIHGKMQSVSFPEKWRDEQLRHLSLEGITDVGQTIWGQVLLERATENGEYWLRETRSLLEDGATESEFLEKYGASVSDLCIGIKRFLSLLPQGWQAVSDFASAFKPLAVKKLSGCDDLKERWKKCRTGFQAVLEVFSSSSDELLQDLRCVSSPMQELLNLVFDYDEAFSKEKRRRNLMDFSDLEHFAIRLLCDPDTGAPTGTALALSRKYREIMVDEYQDVNRVQDTLFHAVSRNGENLFFVGDVKQSIYRFRLADPTVFLEKYDNFLAGIGGKCISLSRNFRSRESVLEAVNWVFGNTMSRQLGEIDYSEREKLYPGASFPEGEEMKTELCVVDAGEDEEDEGETEDKVRLEAAYVAMRISEMAGRLMLSDGHGGVRKAEYGDFTILMRSPKRNKAIYASELQKRGIPVAAENEESLFEQPEIRETVSLLTIIANPDEDIPLVSTLRSPVFGFSADLLGRIRIHNRCSFYESVVRFAEEGNEDCRNFLALLQDFREMAELCSTQELMQYIYRKTGIPGIYSAMSGGIRRRNNLWRFVQLVGEVESHGYRGLHACVNQLRQVMEQGKSVSGEEAPSRQNAVEITSIHHSKGLEYPVVFLTDLAHQFNRTDTQKPLLFHQQMGFGPRAPRENGSVQVPTIARDAIQVVSKNEMLSEELRLLYVGMTRAREKLIMTCSYKNADKTLQRLLDSYFPPLSPQRLRSCQSMAEWVLLTAFGRKEFTLKSEEPIFEIPENAWRILYIPRVRNTVISAPAAESEIKEKQAFSSGLSEILRFSYPFRQASEIPSKLTATELKGRAKDEESSAEAEPILQIHADAERRVPDFAGAMQALSAAEHGTAIHLALQFADGRRCMTLSGAAEEADRLENEKRLTSRQRRSLDCAMLVRFWNSALGARVLSAEKVYREFKFSLLTDSGELGYVSGEKILLQGVVDCFFEENGKLILLDFKSDRTQPDGEKSKAEEYRLQLDTYAKALERILGLPVTEKNVFFLHSGVCVDLV